MAPSCISDCDDFFLTDCVCGNDGSVIFSVSRYAFETCSFTHFAGAHSIWVLAGYYNPQSGNASRSRVIVDFNIIPDIPSIPLDTATPLLGAEMRRSGAYFMRVFITGPLSLSNTW